MADRTRRLGEKHPTGPQVRAARALVDISMGTLAQETQLALNTIKRAEAAEGPVPLTLANVTLIVATLERRGVRFVSADDECGPGVRLELKTTQTEPELPTARRRPRRRPAPVEETAA